MKKMLLLVLAALFILALSTTVSAQERHHQDWGQPAYNDGNWHRASYQALPFGWHQHHEKQVKRIYDREWNDRFPGLHSYKWHGDGFWYRGHRVSDAVLFYNDSDELVSVGFVHNGSFIFIRDDHNGYENQDSFFISWLTR